MHVKLLKVVHLNVPACWYSLLLFPIFGSCFNKLFCFARVLLAKNKPTNYINHILAINTSIPSFNPNTDSNSDADAQNQDQNVFLDQPFKIKLGLLSYFCLKTNSKLFSRISFF